MVDTIKWSRAARIIKIKLKSQCGLNGFVRVKHGTIFFLTQAAHVPVFSVSQSVMTNKTFYYFYYIDTLSQDLWANFAALETSTADLEVKKTITITYLLGKKTQSVFSPKSCSHRFQLPVLKYLCL